MQVGVFVPINNNGWLISENARNICRASTSTRKSPSAPKNMASISCCR